MTGKRVGIALKPGSQKRADAWVTQTSEDAAPEEATGVMKRLTIDIPEDLHRKLKVKAASDGVKMADLVRGWIEAGCAS